MIVGGLESKATFHVLMSVFLRWRHAEMPRADLYRWPETAATHLEILVVRSHLRSYRVCSRFTTACCYTEPPQEVTVTCPTAQPSTWRDSSQSGSVFVEPTSVEESDLILAFGVWNEKKIVFYVNRSEIQLK